MNNKPVFNYPLFAMGYKAFFALAGLSALALIAVWNSISNGSLHMANYYPASIWHGHEMLFGFSVAVMAGFLLTAVNSWTGRRVVTPDQLAALSLLWIYGRVAPFYSGLLADELIAIVDLLFLPALGYFLLKAVLGAGYYRYLPYIGLLAVMFVANILIHAQILALWAETVSGLNLLIGLLVVMIVAGAGSVFPLFTERALKGVICIRNPLLDIVAVVSSGLAFACLLLDVSGLLLAISALVALVSNLWRIAIWYDRRIWFVPLLWILYAGYGWLVLGFMLMAMAAYTLVPPSLALHAFTVGGIGVLSLGGMARVALGRSGRVLKVSNLLAIVFLVINLVAVLRVVLPVVAEGGYSYLLLISSYGWLLAFSLFVFHFTPILTEADSTAD
jgi:uncharacterized protein involved in response to NO